MQKVHPSHWQVISTRLNRGTTLIEFVAYYLTTSLIFTYHEFFLDLEIFFRVLVAVP